jgi:ribonuclease E
MTKAAPQAEVEVEKKPVTRDVEVAKAQPEAEPAPVLELTPPKAVPRVANDPRERRRLAKQAAEQAFEQAKKVQEPVVTETPAAETATPETVAAVTENTVVEAPVDANTEVNAIEPLNAAETAAQVEMPTQAETPVVTEDVVTETLPETTAEVEDDAAKISKDKNARPRRPRGRPPKKATPTAE